MQQISRAEVLSKVGRDIVLLWLLCFVLLSFHSKILQAHQQRVLQAGSFNTISILRALGKQETEDRITVAQLTAWYQPLGHILPDGPKVTLPDGFGLGAFDTSYLVDIKQFGLADTCSVLVQLDSVAPPDTTSFLIYPAYRCLMSRGYHVFPTRLVFETSDDGLGYIKYAYFSMTWADAFSWYIDAFSFVPYCEVRDACLKGEYKPVDFKVRPQPYFSDDRVSDEFRMPAELITWRTVNEEVLQTINNGQAISDRDFDEIRREAERTHARLDDENSEAFFQFVVSVAYIPFLGILVCSFLCSGIGARLMMSSSAWRGDGIGQLLGPSRWWNVPHVVTKALMVSTPVFSILLVGAVFQDVFRMPIIGWLYSNPLDGVLLTSSRDIDVGGSVIAHSIGGLTFLFTFVVWLIGFFGACLASALLLLHTFVSVKLILKMIIGRLPNV